MIVTKFPQSSNGDWVNPEYAYTDDENYATAPTHDYLQFRTKWYDFGFSIPTHATINSVTVNVAHKADSPLYRSFSIDSIEGVINFSAYDNTEEILTSVVDSYAWTPTELNNNAVDGFYISLMAWSADRAITSMVNYISVTVDYSVAASNQVSMQII